MQEGAIGCGPCPELGQARVHAAMALEAKLREEGKLPPLPPPPPPEVPKVVEPEVEVSKVGEPKKSPIEVALDTIPTQELSKLVKARMLPVVPGATRAHMCQQLIDSGISEEDLK